LYGKNLDIVRYSLRNNTSGELKVIYLRPEQAERCRSQFTDRETGQELELLESLAMLDWLANNYKSFGAKLEIVTDKSQEGAQFVRGFGGIGGMLRYQVDFQAIENAIADAMSDGIGSSAGNGIGGGNNNDEDYFDLADY